MSVNESCVRSCNQLGNQTLFDIIDIIDRMIIMQKIDLFRSLYNAGDWELVPPYTG